VQELAVAVPGGTPPDFYGIEVELGGCHYFSDSAVRIYDTYPASWGFVHITDTHIGYDEETYSATERLGFFVEEANFLNPELVVVTGDVCEDQTLGHDWPQQFLEALSGLRVPAYVLPGNHDHYNIDGLGHNPAGILRYFHEINRFENSVLEMGGARFYGLNTRENLGLIDFYRCLGPTSDALDWVESEVAGLGSAQRPRFLLMHGPNYDYFSWNRDSTGRVRDIMNVYDFALGLAGHTHRFETYLNDGTNSFGRNDYVHEDDWGRDVAFPGYPLHVQTSSLGKEEHLSARVRRDALGSDDPGAAEFLAELAPLSAPDQLLSSPGRRGLFGDDIGWRWVQVDGTDVSFFTSDTDGDGYRNTEDPWLLGEIRFTVEEQPDGTIVSSVENLHCETWTDVRHYIHADPGTEYLADGGTLLRRLPDGTVVVAVDSVGWLATSVVTLTPEDTGSHDGIEVLALGLGTPTPNPFGRETTIAFELPCATDADLSVYDVGGRLVANLVDRPVEPGRHEVTWSGYDRRGEPVANGVYFARLSAGGKSRTCRFVRLN
jgi:predicted phosphodiesterase